MIVLCSDSHIGAGASLGRLPDQESSWKRLCLTACEMDAHVIHAGDVFQSRRPAPAEMRAFQAGLEILRECDLALYVCLGNHDRVDLDTPTGVEAACAGYRARVFREAEVIEIDGALVAFLPWTMGQGDAKRTTEALMVAAESMAEQGARVLVPHFAMSGGSLPNGLPTLSLTEPMLDAHRLAELYRIVIAGHIHRREIVIDDGVSLVAQCGPLTRSGFGEASVETGGWQIDGARATPFDVPDRAFVVIEEDLRGIDEPERELVDAISTRDDIKDAIVRVSYRQTADQVISQFEIADALTHYAGAWRVESVQPIIERATSVRSQGISETTDPRESWDRWADGQEIPDAIAETVRESAHERIASVS